MVGDVLAIPDSLAVRLLDHRCVVEAPRLLNVRRLQVRSHITHSAPRERNRPPMTDREHADCTIRTRDRPDRDELLSHRCLTWPQVYAESCSPLPSL